MGNNYLHNRRSIRLPEYDYSQLGEYFITIVSDNRKPIFGSVDKDRVRLTEIGKIVRMEWLKTPSLRPGVELGDFVIMPNHFHGIIHLLDDGRGTSRCAPTVEHFGKPVVGSIPTIVRAFKSAVTKSVHEKGLMLENPVWQRNYYEHIICSDLEYESIAAYIAENPQNWITDVEHPR
jgi:putative transposase